MYTDRLAPAGDHLVRLTLHKHHPTVQFSAGPVVSRSRTWVEVEIVGRSDTYDGPPVVTALDVDIDGSNAAADIAVAPPESGVWLTWSVIGTDGFTDSGSVSTVDGVATFTVPVGAGGVEDIATVTLPENESDDSPFLVLLTTIDPGDTGFLLCIVPPPRFISDIPASRPFRR